MKRPKSLKPVVTATKEREIAEQLGGRLMRSVIRHGAAENLVPYVRRYLAQVAFGRGPNASAWAHDVRHLDNKRGVHKYVALRLLDGAARAARKGKV